MENQFGWRKEYFLKNSFSSGIQKMKLVVYCSSSMILLFVVCLFCADLFESNITKNRDE